MEMLSLIIGIIGITPLLYVCYKFLLNYLPIRSFFSFTDNSVLDVIITTSSVTQSPKGAKVQRATTGIGQVLGVSNLSKFIGKFYKNLQIDVHMGKSLSIRPKKDIVLLGGPSKNEYSSRFIQGVCEKNPELELLVDDINSLVKVKGYSYEISDLNIKNGLPTKDIGIVILSGNPFSSEVENGRAIYCAGLTSYGTSGSSMWLFNDLINDKSSLNILTNKVGGKSPNFLAILNLEVINGGVAAVKLIDAFKIKR